MTEEMLLLAKGLLDALHKAPERYDLPKIEAAYALAYHAHEGQKRQSGEPYICHPLAVAESVVGLGLDTDTVCAALLHDTVEDCDGITDDFLRERFGADVATIVAGVTKIVTVAIENNTAVGQVKLGAMYWTARSTTGNPIPEGTLVRVDRVEGVKVYVSTVEVSAKV